MKRPHDEFRLAAEHAALVEIEATDSNHLSRGHMWRAVNAAIDAYEEQLVLARMGGTRQAWAVLRENGEPWVVCPTYRSARRQRADLAVLSATYRWRLRIVKTEVVDL